ncbi:MAG: hypothetical protein KF752_04935 [Pirellulaceae bacterium]|nr:hypothetical protein [Pirellulaceae bacterium]
MEETPFEDRVVSRAEIDWDRSAWWWYPITRAIHPAVRMTSLFVSLVAVLLIQQGVGLAERWFSPGYDWGSVLVWSERYGIHWPVPQWIDNLPTLSIQQLAYASFCLVWIGMVGALLGGLLARRAAVELGQRTIADWGRTAKVIASRWMSFFWAIAMHFVALLCLLLPIVILGWASRLGDVAAAVTGVLLIVLSIPLMFAVGRLLISLLIGVPLSICAISIENKADAFEGFSRSNAYIFQRPVVVALLVVALGGLGQVGALLVQWTVQAGWGFISATYRWSVGGLADDANRYLQAGGWLAENLVLAYGFSFFWSASVAIYLILRRSVDGTPLDEVYQPESAIEKHPPQIPTTSQPAEAQQSEMDKSDSSES